MKRLTWYNQLGFRQNPFTIKPSSERKIIGNEESIKEILLGVEQGKVLLIEGEYGFGKTTLLKRIVEQFKDDFRIIYFSRNKKESSIDFDEMLINAGGFFHKLFRLRKKHNILLIDEAQDLNLKDLELLPKYYKDQFFHSIALVSHDFSTTKFPDELKLLFDGNIFPIKSISEDEAVVLIRKRVGDLPLLTDDIIKETFRHSKNPRKLLEDLEDICRIAVEKGKETVSSEDLKVIISS
jgi:energy-coupling factor transporter ATP-binding protein EcfA2